MKKICHFSSAHGGLEIRIFRKQCVSLAKAGYDTHLVINAEAGDVAKAADYGVTLHPLDYSPTMSRFKRMFLHAWRCYRKARAIDADLYHFHDPELIPYGLLLAWSGKQVIFDVHEDIPGDVMSKHWIPLRMRRIVSAMCKTVQDFSARRFAAVVTATPFIGTLFVHSAKRVVVVNNYPLFGELSLTQDTPTKPRDSVCYVGMIDPIRGIREIVQAASAAGAKLLLAGRFATEELRNEMRRYQGWDAVSECGIVDRQGVSDILSRSYSGLVTLHQVPNFVNSQPIKMFEYMSAGVPVIASNFPLWREVVEGNQCGICVDPNDPEAISAAIRHLRDNPEEVTRLGKNGRLAVESKYRWDHEEGKLLALYKSLLGE